MVTRDDVARRAGTSTAVVSYVVNDGPRPVAPETRERVLAAVAELGYRPNAIARSLRAATSDTIGVLLPDHGLRSSALLAGIESVTSEHDVLLVVGTGPLVEDGPARQVRAFVDRRTDGILLLTRDRSAGVVAELARSKTPSIEIYPVPGDSEADVRQDALVDEAAALGLLQEHLATHGFGRPLLAADSAEATAWFDGAGDADLVHDEASRIGRAVLERLSRGDGHDAVICGSVPVALAVQRALDGRGRADHRPAVAALTDELADANAQVHDLTVAGHPWEQIGALAVTTLLERIADRSREVHALPTVAAQIRCRASCRSAASPPRILASGGRAERD